MAGGASGGVPESAAVASAGAAGLGSLLVAGAGESFQVYRVTFFIWSSHCFSTSGSRTDSMRAR